MAAWNPVWADYVARLHGLHEYRRHGLVDIDRCFAAQHQEYSSRELFPFMSAVAKASDAATKDATAGDRALDLARVRRPSQMDTPSMNPDGDTELPSGTTYADFSYVDCPSCNALLKPQVVFFGEGLRPDVRDAASEMVNSASAVLVIGSSLATMSSLRLVRSVANSSKQVAIINLGTTRADDLAGIKVDGKCGHVLPALIAALETPDDPALFEAIEHHDDAALAQLTRNAMASVMSHAAFDPWEPEWRITSNN